jgi:hypothetical protein
MTGRYISEAGFIQETEQNSILKEPSTTAIPCAQDVSKQHAI